MSIFGSKTSKMAIFTLFVTLWSLFWSKMTMLDIQEIWGLSPSKMAFKWDHQPPKGTLWRGLSEAKSPIKLRVDPFQNFWQSEWLKTAKMVIFGYFGSFLSYFGPLLGHIWQNCVKICVKFEQNLTIFVQSQLIANPFCGKKSQNETFLTKLETPIVVFVQKRSPLKNSFKMWSFLSLKSQNPHKRLALVFSVFSEKD